MHTVLPPHQPLFALGGTIYPVPEQWPGDPSDLADAVRETHVAIRMHHQADRSPGFFILCECSLADGGPGVGDHLRRLTAGYLALMSQLPTEVPAPLLRRLPVAAPWLRAAVALGALAVALEACTASLPL